MADADRTCYICFIKKPVSLFITYNPQNQSERILANRLHTIAAVNGFNAFLPDRFYDGFIISDATRKYIQIAGYFILFSFGPLSEAVKSEIILAYQKTTDACKIFVVYDRNKGKNLTGDLSNQFTPIYYDTKTPDLAYLQEQIFEAIQKNQLTNTLSLPKKVKEENDVANAIGALLGIGLGLVVLGSVFGKK